jgi:hypothetical protein
LPARVRVSAMKAPTMSTAPIGTLIRKTHRQDSPVVSTPPATAPTMPPMPPEADHAPKALARSNPATKYVLTTASVAGASIAAPKPCATRAPTKISGVPARPPRRLASENNDNPATSIRRRPSRSIARPPSSMNPANVST